MNRLTVVPERVAGKEVIDSSVDVEGEALAAVEAAALHRRLDLLPSAERQTLIWSYGLNGVGELTLKEIGSRLGRPITTVWRLRQSGLSHMRELYGLEGESSASPTSATQARANGTRLQ